MQLAGEPVALLEHGQLPAGLVQAGVLDEHRGVGGEVAHEPLVVGGEAAVLVGQVEGGRPRRHGTRWARRGTRRGRGGPPGHQPTKRLVAAHVLAAERLGVEQRGAEHAVRSGERADGVDLLVGEPGGDPPAEPVALLVGDAEGGVAGPGQAPGRLDEPLEHGVGAQVAGDPEERLAHRRQRRRPISHGGTVPAGRVAPAPTGGRARPVTDTATAAPARRLGPRRTATSSCATSPAAGMGDVYEATDQVLRPAGRGEGLPGRVAGRPGPLRRGGPRARRPGPPGARARVRRGPARRRRLRRARAHRRTDRFRGRSSERGPLPREEVAGLGAEVADALAYDPRARRRAPGRHARRTSCATRTGAPRLVDFGIARLARLAARHGHVDRPWAPPRTWRPSRCRARTSRRPPTSTPSASCCWSADRAPRVRGHRRTRWPMARLVRDPDAAPDVPGRVARAARGR